MLSGTSYRFVDFFFVLSGFVIAYSSAERLARGRGEAKAFMIRRIARLWPLHVFVLLLFAGHQAALLLANELSIIVDPVAFSGDFALQYILPNLALVQAWGFLPQATWNEPAWSISVEMFAYIVFALDAVLTRGRLWLLAPLTLAAVVYAVAVPATMTATYDVALVRGILGFGIGVVCYRIWLRARAMPFHGATLWEIIAAGSVFVAIIYLPRSLGYMVVPIFAVAVLVFAREQGWLSRLLARQVFQELGKLSYSVYLLHPFVLVGIFSLAAISGHLGEDASGRAIIAMTPLLSDVVLVGYLVLVVLLSRLTYRFIELPGQRIGKRIAADKRPAPG